MSEVESRVSDLEAALMKLVYAQFKTQMALQQLTRKTEAFQDEMKEFKDEMKEFKDEMKEFKDETQASHKEMNKRWGELANKMGTVVEDIVAPNIRRIAREYFGCPDLEFFAVRIDKRHPADPSRRREFDVVAVGGDLVFLNETKSTVRSSYVADYIDFIRNDEFFAYFPEYKGKRLIPLFASLSVPEDKVTLLSKAHIYVMAMTDTTMDLINFQAVGGDSSE